MQLKATRYRYYDRSAELIKFFLMPFVCFWTFGFPDKIGIVGLLSGFAPQVFFAFSGYYTLYEDEEGMEGRLKRSVTRNGIFFGILFVVYSLINLLNPISSASLSLNMLRSKRMWFNFLVLNVWPLPIGDSIWFIQALLYADIILLIAYKLKLLKFYKVFLVVLTVISLLTGEFARVIGFNVLGYPYIPGGFLTKALPYMLLGMLIREKYDYFKRIKAWRYIVYFVLGGVLVIGEVLLLGRIGCLDYVGHFLGFAVMVFAVCGLNIAWEDIGYNPISYCGGGCAKIVYALHNPLYYLILTGIMMANADIAGIFVTFAGLIVWVLCAIIGFTVMELLPVEAKQQF